MIFTYNNGSIGYTDSGKGAPVVLLHGYLETSETWDGFAEKLAERFRVITVDLPGHGMSDSFGTTHTMEFMADIVRELLDRLGIRKVFLTGHSLGGYVVLAFLDLYPGMLSGYCLFHSHPFPDTPEIKENRKREIALAEVGKMAMFYPGNITRMYASHNLETFSFSLKRSLEIASLLSGKGIAAVLHGMMERPERLQVMEDGRAPCLWILGSEDNYIPCDSMQQRVVLPSNARVVVLKNSGHLGFIEEQNLSLEILSDFIASLR